MGVGLGRTMNGVTGYFEAICLFYRCRWGNWLREVIDVTLPRSQAIEGGAEKQGRMLAFNEKIFTICQTLCNGLSALFYLIITIAN